MKEKDSFERIFLSSVMSKNSSLMFTVEQWELTRRLRLTGLTKEQVGQAFDDLDKMEKDLSCLFPNFNPSTSNINNNNINTSTTTTNSTSNSQHDLVLKNFQMIMAKNLANFNQQKQQVHQQQQQQQTNSSSENNNSHNSNNNNNNNNSSRNNNSAAVLQSEANAAFMVVFNHFLKENDPDVENKEIEEFKSKGEVAIHQEISFFVFKHDLKQSQISRMAGVNQAYVSKFLRGEFFELSENGKLMIYKWYLRFLKNPTIFLQTHKITLGTNSISASAAAAAASSNVTNTTNSNTNSTITTTTNNNNQSSILHNNNNNFINDSISRLNTYSSFAHNVTNLSLDTPKRTRFSFKPEHLAILENAFTENQYPDQKKREEITKLCNGSRNCSDREKVTEQVITHWFQNKRKITRKYDSTKSPDEQKLANNNSNNHHHQHNYKNNTNNNNNNNSSNTTNNHLDTTSNSNNSPLNYQEYIEEPPSFNNDAVLSKPNSSPSKSNEESSDDMY